MIEGVVVKDLVTHPDERGFFREVVRFGDVGFDVKQASHAFRIAGQANGWHIHRYHHELFYVTQGVLRVCLKDCRNGYPIQTDYPYDDLREQPVVYGQSSTELEYQEVVLSEYDPRFVIVPRGVAHGYKVLQDADIFYFASATYETSRHDEGRIDPSRWPQHDWTRGIPTR